MGCGAMVPMSCCVHDAAFIAVVSRQSVAGVVVLGTHVKLPATTVAYNGTLLGSRARLS